MYIRIGYLPFARVSLKLKSDLIFSNYSKLAEFVSKFRLFYAKKQERT